MASKSFDLMSPLPRDECVRRLRTMTDRWNLFGRKPVIGYVGEVSLRLRKRIGYANPFQRFLFAKLSDEGGHTRLRCRVRMHPFVIAFYAFWFGGVLLIGGAQFITAIAKLLECRIPILANAWPAIAIPLLMLGFGIALLQFGRFLSRSEENFLIDFLRRSIDIREA